MFLTKDSSKTLLWLVVCLFCVGVTSCNKDEMSSFPEEEMAAEATPLTSSLPHIIQIEDDYLVFADQEHFNNTLKELKNKSQEELNEWEEALGFKSVRYYRQQAIKETSETETLAEYESVRQKYSNKARFNEDGTIQMLINIAPLSNILNINGLVKIGDLLHQYTENKVVAIKGSDKAKLKAAQSKIETDKDNDIYVGKVEVRTVNNEKSSICSVNYTSAIGAPAKSKTVLYASNFQSFSVHFLPIGFDPITGNQIFGNVAVPFNQFTLSYEFEHLRYINAWRYTPVQLYQSFNYTFDGNFGTTISDKYQQNLYTDRHSQTLEFYGGPGEGIELFSASYFAGFTHLTVPGAPPGQRGCHIVQ